MKLGFVSLPFTGHLNSMTALARKLRTRGHEVVFIGIPDIGPRIHAAGLTFVPYCENEFPVGSLDQYLAPMSRLNGLAAVQNTNLHLTPGLAKAAFEHLPRLIKEIGVEALVIDTLHRFLELVPMSLNIPCVHIWNTLHIDGTGATPACIYNWPHQDGEEARARNLEGLKKLGGMASSTLVFAKAYAEKAGLQIDWTNPATAVPRLAVITQTPKEFDFEGIPWPAEFHYAGPFHDVEGRPSIPFPWEKLNGKPLIYASLGTVVNGLDHVYKIILESAAKLSDAQLVLSVGTNIDLDRLEPIPQGAIVVRKAPQIELLTRAALCITHAGLNTVLESLAQGVPMVAIPIAFDQPGIASRIAYHGVGEFVELDNLSVDTLLRPIRKALTNHSYAERVHYFKEVIAKTRGLDMAADIIEEACRKPAARFVGERQHDRLSASQSASTSASREGCTASQDFVTTIVPRWADMDLNQHMRHSAFADWAAFARTEWLNANGCTMEKLVELRITPVMFEDRTKYLKEVRLGERIHIELQLAGLDREGSKWFVRHIFRRGTTVCAVCEAKGAWFSVATRRLVPAPPGLLEAYSNLARTDDYAELSSGESVAA